MPSTASLLDFWTKVEQIAKDEGLPDPSAGLRFMKRVEDSRTEENQEKKAERAEWEEKRPMVAEFYRKHPHGRFDVDDVAEHAGLAKTRGNRTRIFKELKLLGHDPHSAKMAAD